MGKPIWCEGSAGLSYDYLFGDSVDGICKEDSLSKFIISCGYRQRYMESIFRNVTAQVSNILTDLEKIYAKKKWNYMIFISL